jgi:hypothetical protein
MSDDAPRWASFSSAFSIVLSLASNRIAELGCDPVGDDPKTFVDRGGLRRLETEAADAAIRRVREAAYPLIFKLFGSEMPRGKERKVVLARLSQDLSRIETTLGYNQRPARDDGRETPPKRLRRTRSGSAQRTRLERTDSPRVGAMSARQSSAGKGSGRRPA